MGKLLPCGICRHVVCYFAVKYRRTLLFHLLPYKVIELDCSSFQAREIVYMHDLTIRLILFFACSSGKPMSNYMLKGFYSVVKKSTLRHDSELWTEK
jgi:hypothetical protein